MVKLRGVSRVFDCQSTSRVKISLTGVIVPPSFRYSRSLSLSLLHSLFDFLSRSFIINFESCLH